LIFKIFKVLLAGGLLFWLVKSGGIRPEYLLVPSAQIPVLGGACLLIAISMLLSAPRYVQLLKGVGLSLSIRDGFRISMIMYFFTQCVLGTASGDVARYYYTTRITGQGAKVGAAIIIDRIVGIMGLFMLAGIAMVYNWALIEYSLELQHLAVPILTVFVLLWLGVVLGFLALVRGRWFGFWVGVPFVIMAGVLWLGGSGFGASGLGPVLFYSSALALFAPLIAPEFMDTGYIYKKFFKGSKLGMKLGEVVDAILFYRNSVSTVLKIVFLTMAQHLTLIFSLYLFSQIQNIPQLPDFNQIFFAAPLAFLAGIIPAPAAGLGVNEAAFETLLSLISGQAIVAGASIYLMLRIWTTLFSMGGFFFIGNKKDRVALEK